MTESYTSFFLGKKITLMGLGLLGRGVGDAEFLAGAGANLIVTDLKNENDLAEPVARLKKFKNIQFVLGQHRQEDFTEADMVIKAAGVPLDSFYIRMARENGVPVYMSSALFATFTPAKIIGVTGTRGKSTTAQMIYHVLKEAGKPVHLGGNIRGMSTLAMLPDIKKNGIVVLELDSWQLQGFRDLKLSPHIAVFTNLMPDHMNYYGHDMNLYFNDKAAIFTHQSAKDFLIYGENVADRINAAHPSAQIITPNALPKDWKLSIPGDHNRVNAALAAAALRAAGLDDSTIKKYLQTYAGLEGRLSLSAETNGVKIYNDTNATTPAAVIAALKSFEGKNIFLIAGGADKNLELKELSEAINQYTHQTVLLKGSGTDKLLTLLPKTPVFNDLKSAFDHVMDQAKSGDVVLLSPGFASFGMFKNEYDRGDQFEALARDRIGIIKIGKRH